jgi:group II intron reverse transcriptase/maturase
MRSPARVLNSLTKHSQTTEYRFERLYRILFNEEMYYLAYQRIYAKPGNMTQGADGKTIDRMSLSRIEKLIASLKDESYSPQPSRRMYIPKKNGKTRPLGVPSFDDKLVQEVVRMVLEAIYEGHFEDTSHGFRPHRSCHTALNAVQKTFTGKKWFIEGDIKGFFDNVNHDILIDILKERISDERFIRLIRKFLKAGYLEQWQFHGTYSGMPQGGIISPILANIYLDKLDKYMKEYASKFDKGDRGRQQREYEVLTYQKRLVMRELKTATNNVERKVLVKRLKEIDKTRSAMPCFDPMDGNFKRLKYVRYADDFLIGIIGSKEDAVKIKDDIKRFLADRLALELSDEKTLVTHTEKPAKFLGYEVTVRKSNLQKRNKRGSLSRVYGNKVRLKVTTEVIKKKLLELGVLKFSYHNGHEQWIPKHRSELINNDDLEILDSYNAEIRGFYNYYSIANNASELNTFHYIMQYSMYKTFAGKYRTTVRRICQKYKRNGVFTVGYTVKNGQVKERRLYNEGFKRKRPSYDRSIDRCPNPMPGVSTTSLIDRLKAQKCELCGATDNLVMHHVRKLGELKGKENWEKLMIARRRKTMAVCGSCHQKIHHGTF